MSNIGEGTAVDKRGRTLERLHQIGLERILEQGRHGTLSLKVTARTGSPA